MRNLAFTVLLSTTICSCYSYKNTKDITSFEQGKNYRITDIKGIKTKINIIEVRNDIIIASNENQKITIPINEISKSEKRKFSWLKTTACIIIPPAIFVGAIAIALSNTRMSMGELQSPP